MGYENLCLFIKFAKEMLTVFMLLNYADLREFRFSSRFINFPGFVMGYG